MFDAAGHRLRLALSLSDFPRVFPLPHQGKIHLHVSPEGPQSLALRILPVEKRMDARLDADSKIEFSLEGNRYAATVRQRVTQSQIEISTRVEEAGDVIHEREFSRDYEV